MTPQSQSSKHRCDLNRMFGLLARRLPTTEDRSCVVSAKTLPLPSENLRTSRLIIQNGGHDYGLRHGCRLDTVLIQCSRETYRQLGVLILAVVFHGKQRVCLELTHPNSDVRQIVLGSSWRIDSFRAPHYQERPISFRYWPRPVMKHPWHPWQGLGISVFDLPSFELSNPKGSSVTEKDWMSRDTVYGIGSDRASVMFAELLLNFSRPKSLLNEVVLEGEPGFRGVGPASAEVSLYLPGGFGWFSDWWGKETVRTRPQNASKKSIKGNKKPHV